MEDPGGTPSLLGPDSPQAVATAWVEAVMDRGDLGAAWAVTAPELRLVLAQDWIWTHRREPAVAERDQWESVARALAAWPPAHSLWPRFASDRVAEWHRIWRGFSARTWRAWHRPEAVGVDLEMVTFVETAPGVPGSSPGTAMLARRFLVRHTGDGWLVAGLNAEQRFRPGWPPSPE